MNQTLKLTLLVITGFISLTALMASAMMLSVEHYTAYRTGLTVTFFAGIGISVFAIVQIIKLNTKWKDNQLKKAFETWAEWTVEGIEWKKYQEIYTSEKTIKKDAFIYSLTGAIIWCLFIGLVMSAAGSFSVAVITSLATTPVFWGLLYIIILKVSNYQTNHLAHASKAEIKAYSELLLVNGKAIFLNTPGLKPCTLKIEEKDGVFSAVLILESLSPRRRITQQHRIPFPASKADVAHACFEKIRKIYNI